MVARLDRWKEYLEKGPLPRVVMATILGSLMIIAPQESKAQSCERYQKQVDYYTDLRRRGGSSRQMTTWQRERNKYKDLYHECRRKGGSDGSVDRVSGPRKHRDYSDHRNTYRITINNKAVRKLHETCNYWIRQHNRNPTRDTLTFRNTACEAAREGEAEVREAGARDIEHVRSFKECVKPNNTIDNEVSKCLEGKIKPYWKE